MAEKGGQQVSFSFQVGLVKDKITVDITDLTLKYLKTLATSFVNEKFPEHEVGTEEKCCLVLTINHEKYSSPGDSVGGAAAGVPARLLE